MLRHRAIVALLFLGVACQAPTSEDEATPALEGRLGELQRAVEAAPDDPTAIRSLAIALHAEGDRDRALPHFERLVELDPSPRHLLDLALGYSSLSRLEESRATYGRLLQVDPDNAIAHHNLGNLEMRFDRIDVAMAHYQRAIQIDPNYLVAWAHLADALRRAERFKDAYRAYGRVLALEPTDAEELAIFDDALYQLAALDLKMGATERALQLLEELLFSRPDHNKAHYAHGTALMRLGRTAEAQQAFERHMKILDALQPSGTAAMPG